MSNRSLHDERRPKGSKVGSARGSSSAWQDLPETIKYGDLCFQAERYSDALEAYQRALPPSSKKRLPPDLRARLHYRIAHCFIEKANYRMALEQLDLARKTLPRHLDKTRLAKIYGLRGRVMSETGQYDRARRYLSWAQKLLRGTSEHEELALVERRLGAVFARTGRYAEARDCFLSALATYRRIDHQSGEATVLNSLALFYKNICEYREAVRYLELARNICERIGFRQSLISINLNLAIVHFKLSKWELCEENLAVAERLASELGSNQFKVKVFLASGNLALRRQLWGEAEALYLRAEEIAKQEGYARERLLAVEFHGELDVARGRWNEAVERLEPTLKEAHHLAPSGDIVYEVQRRLAEAHLGLGNLDQALALAEEAALRSGALSDRYEEALSERCCGLISHRMGHREGATRVRKSLMILEEIGDTYQKGLTHLEWSRALAVAPGNRSSDQVREEAGRHLQRAYGAFLDLDLAPLAAVALYERAELEATAGRVEEASMLLSKIQRLGPGSVQNTELETNIEALRLQLEDAIAERWATGGDVLTSLKEIQKLFQGSANPEAALNELVRLAATQSGSSRGCVAHFVEQDIEVVAVHGWSVSQAKSLLDSLGSGLYRSLEENRPVWSSNVGEDRRFGDLAGRLEVKSLILIPFTLPEGRPGLLYVDKTTGNSEGDYHQGELHLLTLLANLAALSVVERLNNRLRRENEQLRRMIAQESSRFLTANPQLLESMRLLKKVADSPVSILITGETGTGKGLLAQITHESSNRKDKSFVQINCAALPEQLLESELFGHVKGAFTGATYNKVGLFTEADGGTLFLDEVDKTSLSVQAKLLHVMDTKEVRPVGSVRTSRVDTRVICATNTDLKQRIATGEFLEDLYYRLNDFIVGVPPLRERPEDLPVLVDHFLGMFTAQYDRPDVRLSPETRESILEFSWPGNVRELEKTIRRLVVLSDPGVPVGSDLLPQEIRESSVQPSGPVTLREELARTEKRVLGQALESRGWNRSQVSRELKVSYPSLLKKIKEYGLEPKV